MTSQTFIFIGRSGSGKGTQAKLLQDYLKKIDPDKDTLYIQTGLELREFIKGPSYTQKASKVLYETGGLQPEFIAIYTWVNLLVNKYNANEHLIFDGTPRRRHEAGVLDSIFGFYKLEKAHVIYIDVKKDESVNRLMARKRMDDTRENIEERLSWFERDVIPAIGFYSDNKEYDFFIINGEQAVEAVHDDILKALKI
ncbi:MAG: nucleoside monophosphate kinase [bacterium]|nr:nucleoside monophosphate kinase [bacterium]